MTKRIHAWRHCASGIGHLYFDKGTMDQNIYLDIIEETLSTKQ